MLVDKTTLSDLSIFHHEEELSVFHHLNFTRTIEGKEWLRQMLSKPLTDLRSIKDAQTIIKETMQAIDVWPEAITNGTIMVIERFYDTPVNELPSNPGTIGTLSYQIFSAPDFALTRYSVQHAISFVQGLHQTAGLLKHTQSTQLQTWCEHIKMLLNKPVVADMKVWDKKKKLRGEDILRFGHFLKRQFKYEIFELIDIYSRLDAYYSLAMACRKYGFTFPELKESAEPYIEAKQLFHPLLQTPVAYDVKLNKNENFLFLTGANMAGKSTFIKAIGVAVYMAHIGMGVPAQQMQLSMFDGLLSNIQAADNIIKGESYFFNEVQRIRSTIERISNGKKWLILIDELFKGTNVQDAMKCSTVVIEGLRKMNNALFILSTHLYEIGEALKQYSNIQFRYFETHVENDQLVFSYHLKEGISNDRLGYLILRREGVVDMLEKL